MPIFDGENEIVTTYWLDNYLNNGHCSLCGGSGVINTAGTRTATGFLVGKRNWCICPNGQQNRFFAKGGQP